MITITVARKALVGSVRDTVETWGTGTLNIDACRLAFRGDKDKDSWRYGAAGKEPSNLSWKNTSKIITQRDATGRWPANFILQHGCRCSRCNPVESDGYRINRWENGSKPFGGSLGDSYSGVPVDEGWVESWVCDGSCSVVDLNRQSGVTQSQVRVGSDQGESLDPTRENWRFRRVFGGYKDSGGAARFFKQVGGSE